MTARLATKRCAALGAILFTAACGPTQEEVGTVAGALSADFTDASGTVIIRIKTCAWSSPMAHPQSTCSVDTDFVLVGGGAEIEGEGAPGALLTASYPDLNLTTWLAASKDHVYSYPHRLRAYAVGLKLAGVASSDLRNFVWLQSNTSPSDAHPGTTAELPLGYQLIGGGARANWSSVGQLLTESYPDGFQWVASSKDHIYSDWGSVSAYAIGITTGAIPGFGSIEVSNNNAVTWASGGYGIANVLAPTGWALTSIGGQATYNNVGRMLSDLVPFFDLPTNARPGAWVSSKDHGYSDSGYTRAFAISIRRRP